MVCVLAPGLNQSISRSSSLKGIRSMRKPTRATPGRLEDAVSAPEIIRQHKEASISPERDTEPHEERIIEAVKTIYSCSASKSTFNVYAQDVVLRDNSGSFSLSGVDRLREHFVALQRAFPIANVAKFKISPGASASLTTIVVDIELQYFRDTNVPSPAKISKGFVVLEIADTHDHIVRQTENWDHASQKRSEEAFPSPMHRRTSLSHDDSMYV
ncbi:unnamed protein product [Peniophora sp. CBMAI 1063]|nr:unnamed protein product [Peniophora sp. CBMAI 1063]